MRFFNIIAALAIITIPAYAERMSWLENEHIRVGVDLDLGGAITFLASKKSKDKSNIINNYDYGRQVQMSFYSGPVPFESDGQKPSQHWSHLGWNPIQTGDDFKNKSKVLIHKNDGKQIFIQCRPMQWPLNNVPGECTFESWLELEGNVVKARARLNNARKDHTQYPARLQELPAVYANGAFHRVITYQGTQPFTDDQVALVPKSETEHPWSFWSGTESWAAVLNDNDYGLGLITPGRMDFTGGYFGKSITNNSKDLSTGYLAGQGQEIIDHNIAYEYQYELLLGTLSEIRQRAATHRPAQSPEWTFTQNRQGWHLQNAMDNGWPIKDHLHIALDQQDPQLISPITFWQAEDAPYLIVEAAFNTSQKEGTLMWQRHGSPGFTAQDRISFPINGDGEFHQYVIHLGSGENYKGAMIRLRLDPSNGGEANAWMRVKRIKLSKK